MWHEKYRPSDLDSIVLNEETRTKIKEFIKIGEIPHLLLCGAVGIGKTSLAKMIPGLIGWEHMYINASDKSGIDTIRDEVKSYAEKMSSNGKPKVIILDEAGGLSSKGGDEGGAQGALKNIMEAFYLNIRFILTANNRCKLITPLLSRCLELDLNPPVEDVLGRLKFICETEGIEADDETLKAFVSDLYPDIRSMVKVLQSNIKNGKFVFSKLHRETTFAKKLVNQILNPKVDLKDIREYYLNMGHEFDNNFHLLMTQIHEVMMTGKLDDKVVRKCMLALHGSLRDYDLVMDKEIHFFALCFQMREYVLS